MLETGCSCTLCLNYQQGEEINKDLLTHLYQDLLFSDTQIAKYLGSFQPKISKLRASYNIPTILKSDRRSLPPLTERQVQILLGSLLGDGTLSSTGADTARFQEGHSDTQSDYTRWKAEEFKPYTSTILPHKKISSDGKEYTGLTFTTFSSRAFKEYRDMFYVNGVKTFPPHLESLITPLVLAVWYMDDGCLGNMGDPRISFGLGDNSLKRAFKALKALGLKPDSYGKDSSDTFIVFPGQASEFISLIESYVPDFMKYKIPETTPRRESLKKSRSLESTRALQLFTGGMSVKDIANAYTIGESTVRRKLNLKDVGIKDLRKFRRNHYNRVAAEEKLTQYSDINWGLLQPLDQDQLVDTIYNVLAHTDFPYPERFTKEEASEDFKGLISLQVKVSEDRVIQPLSHRGIRLCTSLFPNRYKASWKGTPSAFEAWHTEKDLKSAIRYQLSVGDPVVPQRVLKAITMRARTPTVFRPVVAKCVYENFCPPGGIVWDPCSGYGGRLLGAMAAGVGKYIATDVEPETVSGNLDLAKMLNLSDRVSINLCPAEQFKVACEVDLVFTSPPYFDRELYSERDDQSWRSHGSSLDSWVDGFLKPVFQESHRSLKDSGYLVINIADIKNNHGKVIALVERTIQAAVDTGFKHVDTLQMPLSKLNKTNPFEPLLVFKR